MDYTYKLVLADWDPAGSVLVILVLGIQSFWIVSFPLTCFRLGNTHSKNTAFLIVAYHAPSASHFASADIVGVDEWVVRGLSTVLFGSVVDPVVSRSDRSGCSSDTV